MIKSRFYGFAFLFLSFVFLSCSFGNSPQKNEIKIVNWNVQTFFDGNEDGNEYKEFVKGKWNRDLYLERLKRLTETIHLLDADVVTLEEIENEDIIYDISNMLSGDSWNMKKVYKYAFFSKEEKSSIGCAVLSRFQISDVKVHSLDVKSERCKQPSLRPIIELNVHKDDKVLKLFVNHWKSKFGGSKESDVWREWQESVLSRLMKNSVYVEALPCLALGDFNKDITEFDTYGGELSNVRLKYNALESIDVFSPWANAEYKARNFGSYFYNDEWECIDNIFIGGTNTFVELLEFTAEREGKWADDRGIPIPYKVWKKDGYSDHLPISCVVRLL